MSDREAIVKLLKRAERRLRRNRLLRDLTFGLSLFLLFPVAFKIWDLFTPFRGTTVAAVLVAWATGLAAYTLRQILQKSTLEQTAAQIDRKAALRDEFKTAYWFITHSRTSDWIDNQIRRASRKASELNVDGLYPRIVPRSSYIAGGLLGLFILLNFIPLPWNHNWVYLQAEPAFSLTAAERSFLAEAGQLLEKTGQLKNTDLAAQIEQIVKDLESGRIDLTEAIKRLKEIESLLRDEPLDADAIGETLDKMAKDFEASDQLKNAAQAMRDAKLAEAASKLEQISDELEKATAQQLEDMQEALKNASQSAQNELKELANTLEASAESLEGQKTEDAQKALEQAARLLKQLSEKLQNQDWKDQAVKRLENLTQSLEERNAGSQEAAQSSSPSEGELSENPDGQQNDEQEVPADGSPESGAGGSGGSGSPNSDAPVEGAPTQNLDVQLEQQRLTGQYDQELKPEELEQASKQERSKLDYRNVPSQLSAGQKDTLNNDQIPWEYRRLIQDYFEAIQGRPERR